MSFDSVACEHGRIDPPAVITHAQAELLVVVADLDLDPPGVRVPEGIPKRFRGNPVDLVANNRAADLAPAPRPRHAKAGQAWALASVASSSPRVRIATARSLRSTVAARKPCTASRPSVIAFAAWSIATSSFSLASAGRVRQQVRSSLEPQQQAVEALKQRVVQLPGDSGALPTRASSVMSNACCT